MTTPQLSLEALLAPVRDARVLLAASPDELMSVVKRARRSGSSTEWPTHCARGPGFRWWP